jgi:hypothetical protein
MKEKLYAEYFAIEKIGYGKKAVYAIKKVIKKGIGNVMTLPVTDIGKSIFRELGNAQKHAANCRLKIEAVGDFYEII